MMLTYGLLFFVPLLSGLIIFLMGEAHRRHFQLLLAFAGAYLFSITVIHILPELYGANQAIEITGLFVLAGFFLQQFLEYFTTGVEHGHMHHGGHHHHGNELSSLVLLSAMSIHAFLEGGILVDQGQGGFNTNALLVGILIHRAPAAFALMTVLAAQLHSKQRAIPHLLGFSIASPLGLFVADYLTSESMLSPEALFFIYALVSGSFLYISTTIVFESSPDHHFSARKLAFTVAGAILAVAIEYIL